MSETPLRPRSRWSCFGLPALGVLAIGLVSVAVVNVWTYSSNCGGNSAALTICGQYANAVQWWRSEHPGETPQSFAELILLPPEPDLWLGSAKFLADPGVFRVDAASPKQVILVCDRPYSNVPRRPWPLPRAAKTHAVAYSDGTAGLISPTEFARLNKSHFVELTRLATPVAAQP